MLRLPVFQGHRRLGTVFVPVTPRPAPRMFNSCGGWPTTRPSARRPRLQRLRGCCGETPLWVRCQRHAHTTPASFPFASSRAFDFASSKHDGHEVMLT